VQASGLSGLKLTQLSTYTKEEEDRVVDESKKGAENIVAKQLKYQTDSICNDLTHTLLNELLHLNMKHIHICIKAHTI